MQLRVIMETLMLIFLMSTTGTVPLTESATTTTDPFQFEFGSLSFYVVMGAGGLSILLVISIAIFLSCIIYLYLRSRHPECLQCHVSCHTQVNSTLNSTLSLAEAAASNEEYKLEENSAYGSFRAQNNIISFTDSKEITNTKGIYSIIGLYIMYLLAVACLAA